MHIIIYSTLYEKKNVFVFVSVALDFTFILVSELQLNFLKKRGVTFYFGIKATVKLLEKKKGVTFYFGIRAYV